MSNIFAFKHIMWSSLYTSKNATVKSICKDRDDRLIQVGEIENKLLASKLLTQTEQNQIIQSCRLFEGTPFE